MATGTRRLQMAAPGGENPVIPGADEALTLPVRSGPTLETPWLRNPPDSGGVQRSAPNRTRRSGHPAARSAGASEVHSPRQRGLCRPDVHDPQDDSWTPPWPFGRMRLSLPIFQWRRGSVQQCLRGGSPAPSGPGYRRLVTTCTPVLPQASQHEELLKSGLVEAHGTSWRFRTHRRIGL